MLRRPRLLGEDCQAEPARHERGLSELRERQPVEGPQPTRRVVPHSCVVPGDPAGVPRDRPRPSSPGAPAARKTKRGIWRCPRATGAR